MVCFVCNGLQTSLESASLALQELSYWRGVLVAQEVKAAELSEEVKCLEMELLEAKQLGKIDSASNPAPLWRVCDLSEAMAKLTTNISEANKQLQVVETPVLRLPRRPLGPSRLGDDITEPNKQ